MKKLLLLSLMVSTTWFACKKESSTSSTNNNTNNTNPIDTTKKDTTVVLPPINGFDSANAIAPSNLLAHWTFENTLNELISGTTPSTSSGIVYTSGVNNQGKAAQFTNGYAVFPTIAALSNASVFQAGFTVSAWVKVINNYNTVSTIFSLSSPKDSQVDWNDGAIEMFVETNVHATGSDTVQLHTAFSSYIPGTGFMYADNLNAYGTPGTDFLYVMASDTTWIHYVAIYDASTSIIQIYANNLLVSNKNFQYRTNGTNPFGQINILTPTQVVLGSFATATVGFTADALQSWQGLFTGTMDNLRVYNTPLSPTQISALYQLELAGR